MGKLEIGRNWSRDPWEVLAHRGSAPLQKDVNVETESRKLRVPSCCPSKPLRRVPAEAGLPQVINGVGT